MQATKAAAAASPNSFSGKNLMAFLDAPTGPGVLPCGGSGFKTARRETGPMLNLLRKSAARKQIAQSLYDELVTRARARVFFAAFEVPDTLDGRFDLLTVHAWLVLARLKQAGLSDTAQELTNIIFTGFDEALREQGAGDMAMARKMKAMADAFFGRLAAYDGADADELAAALARNLWRGGVVDARARALASYIGRAREALASSAAEEGRLDFGALPSLRDA
jgi:cytochrome b pre-mRNA-processing protein 3